MFTVELLLLSGQVALVRKPPKDDAVFSLFLLKCEVEDKAVLLDVDEILSLEEGPHLLWAIGLVYQFFEVFFDAQRITRDDL